MPCHVLRREFRLAIAITLCATAVACADATTAPVRTLAGCYRLQMGGWRESASLVAPLPDSVRLLTVQGTDAAEAGRSLVRAYPDSLRTGFRWAWWQVTAPDTLTLEFTSDAGGARVVLRPQGEGFGGSLATRAGATSEEAVAAWATLTPLRCDG